MSAVLLLHDGATARAVAGARGGRKLQRARPASPAFAGATKCASCSEGDPWRELWWRRCPRRELWSGLGRAARGPSNAARCCGWQMLLVYSMAMPRREQL